MIFDLHNDFLTNGDGNLARLRSRVDACVCAVFRGKRRYVTLEKIVERFLQTKEEGEYLGLEDIGYYTAERSEAICRWKPVYASLTWNGQNALAGGCCSTGRLTGLGKSAIRELGANGIALDVSHLNRESFYDAISVASDRVLASHSCFAALRRHPRNLTDEQARELAARGGVIGVAFVGTFLTTAKARVQDVFRHIDYGVEKFGIEHICIGSDFYGTKDLPEDLSAYEAVGNLKECFERAGYSRTAIRKIFYGNAAEFLQKSRQRQDI